MNNDLLTIHQFAKRTGKSERTVYRWIAKGKLPVMKLERFVRIDWNAFLRQLKKTNTSH